MKIAQRFLKTPVVKAAVLLGCIFNIAVILAFGWMNSNMDYFFNPLKILGEKMIIGFSGPQNSELEQIMVKDKRTRVIRFSNTEKLLSSIKLGSVLDAGITDHPDIDRVDIYLPQTRDNRIPIISNIVKHNISLYEDLKRKQIIKTKYPSQQAKLIFLSDINSPLWHYPGAKGMFNAFFTFIIPLLFIAPGFVCGYIVLEQLREEKRTGTYNLLLTSIDPKDIFTQLLAATVLGCTLVNGVAVLALKQKLLPDINAISFFVLSLLACSTLCAASLKSALWTNSIQTGKTVLFCGFFVLMVPLSASPSMLLTQLCFGISSNTFYVTCAVLAAVSGASMIFARKDQEQI